MSMIECSTCVQRGVNNMENRGDSEEQSIVKKNDTGSDVRGNARNVAETEGGGGAVNQYSWLGHEGGQQRASELP